MFIDRTEYTECTSHASDFYKLKGIVFSLECLLIELNIRREYVFRFKINMQCNIHVVL